MKAKVPEITHLQFVVMGVLMRNDEASGQHIRDVLEQHRIRKSGPAFYQLMARLEDAGFIEGWYEQKLVDGQLVKTRSYKLTSSGMREWQNTRDFYLAQDRLVSHGGLSNA